MVDASRHHRVCLLVGKDLGVSARGLPIRLGGNVSFQRRFPDGVWGFIRADGVAWVIGAFDRDSGS